MSTGENDALMMARRDVGGGSSGMGLTRKPLPDDVKQAGWALGEELDMFVEIAGRYDMPLQYLRTFLRVMHNEGLSVNDYAQQANVSKSVMSRHLLDIGPSSRDPTVPGFGLVESRVDPMERRKHQIYLTPKGRALAQRLARFRANSLKGG